MQLCTVIGSSLHRRDSTWGSECYCVFALFLSTQWPSLPFSLSVKFNFPIGEGGQTAILKTFNIFVKNCKAGSGNCSFTKRAGR